MHAGVRQLPYLLCPACASLSMPCCLMAGIYPGDTSMVLLCYKESTPKMLRLFTHPQKPGSSSLPLLLSLCLALKALPLGCPCVHQAVLMQGLTCALHQQLACQRLCQKSFCLVHLPVAILQTWAVRVNQVISLQLCLPAPNQSLQASTWHVSCGQVTGSS